MIPVFILLLAASPVLLSRAALEEDARSVFSPGRTYRATVEYEPRLTDFVPFSRFELRDAEDRVLYSRPGDGITLLDISDNGIVVGAEFDGPVSGRARLRFLDPAGNETGRADIGFYGWREFSADGSVFVVNDGREGVRVFTDTGRELYRLGPANRFAVSADGRQLALARDDALVLFGDGVEQGRVPLSSPFVRDLRFSEDGALVGYVERHGLRVYRAGDGSGFLSWRPGPADPEPVSLDVSRDGLVLVGLGKARGRNAAVLLDSDGTELWRDETFREQWNAFTPRVRFGPGRTLSIETVEDVRVFGYGEER